MEDGVNALRSGDSDHPTPGQRDLSGLWGRQGRHERT